MGLGRNVMALTLCLGVVFVMSVDTGEVLDYEVKSKYCFECKARNKWDKNSNRYKLWFDSHKDTCAVNQLCFIRVNGKRCSSRNVQ